MRQNSEGIFRTLDDRCFLILIYLSDFGLVYSPTNPPVKKKIKIAAPWEWTDNCNVQMLALLHRIIISYCSMRKWQFNCIRIGENEFHSPVRWKYNNILNVSEHSAGPAVDYTTIYAYFPSATDKALVKWMENIFQAISFQSTEE